MKVVIRNETVWPSAALRRYVVRIAREEFSGKPSNLRSRVTLKVVYNRAGKYFNYCSGRARLNSSAALVRVPFPHPGKRFPVLDFCHVVGHEFGHCIGLQHAKMGFHYRRGTYSNEHYAWAKALPVPEVKKKPKPSVDDKRAAKLNAAEAAVLRWTRKRKLAETKLKLWTRRARALQRLVGAPPAQLDSLSPLVVESTHGG